MVDVNVNDMKDLNANIRIIHDYFEQFESNSDMKTICFVPHQDSVSSCFESKSSTEFVSP